MQLKPIHHRQMGDEHPIRRSAPRTRAASVSLPQGEVTESPQTVETVGPEVKRKGKHRELPAECAFWLPSLRPFSRYRVSAVPVRG
jgi:hypothetical protein